MSMVEKNFGVKIKNIKYQDRKGAYAIIVNDNKIATVKVMRNA